MPEEFPQEQIQPEGIVPIPVTLEGVTEEMPSLDENQDVPTTEVPVIGISSEGLIENPDKALDMAYAGKENREQAIENRELAKTIIDGREIAELDRASGQGRDGNVTLAERDEIEARKVVLDEKYPDKKFSEKMDFIKDADSINTAEAEMVYDDLKGSADLLRWIAEEDDNTADNLENWAGVLYDHPVSEAYKEANQHMEFTPYALSYTEKQIKIMFDQADKVELMLEKVTLEERLDGIKRGGKAFPDITTESMLEQMSGLSLNDYKNANAAELEKRIEPGVKELFDRLISLKSKRETTIGDLSDLFADVFIAKEVEPIRSIAKGNQAMLEDIRSGRAS